MVPGSDGDAQAGFLMRHPVPGGVVLASVPADWAGVSRVGWRVVWCSPGGVPRGCEPLGEEMLQLTVGGLARSLWGGHVTADDSRVVGDVLLGRVSKDGLVLFVSSASGGVGKSASSRRLCERAAQVLPHVLLVDANQRQGSQRSFFDPYGKRDVMTVGDWREGMPPVRGANPGKMLGVRYDVSFAPPYGADVEWGRYLGFLNAARKMWGLVVVDTDRFGADDVADPGAMAGGLLLPMMDNGARLLFIVKAGVQTQADALRTLSRLPSQGIEPSAVGIKDTVPSELDSYRRMDYSQYGAYLGAEKQDADAAQRIAAGQSGWADPNLDAVREYVLQWALPSAGFDAAAVMRQAPAQGGQAQAKRGLFKRGRK